jgi:hypothetical protein
LCFLGRIFFFEWTVILKWEDVVQVQKSKRGICILARSPKDSTFEFEQLQNQDRVWSWLVSLHNDSIIGAPRGPTTARNSARKLRRNNSDPLLMSMTLLEDFGDYTTTTTDDDDVGLSLDYGAPTTSVQAQARTQAIRRDFTYKRTASAPMGDDLFDATRKIVPEESEPMATVAQKELQKQWSAILEDRSTYAEMAIEVSKKEVLHTLLHASGRKQIVSNPSATAHAHLFRIMNYPVASKVSYPPLLMMLQRMLFQII